MVIRIDNKIIGINDPISKLSDHELEIYAGILDAILEWNSDVALGRRQRDVLSELEWRAADTQKKTRP
jgi:hypothetical protein